MSQDTRKDRRAKIVSLNVRYKSATVDEFIENHSHDVSKGGLFIKTPTPFPPGTLLKFEIRIASDKAVIAGVGRVVWKREPTQAGTERPAGMGVKFIKVDDASRATIDRVVGTTGTSGTNFESEMPEEKPSPSVPANPAANPANIPRPPLVRRATMAGLGEGSIRPEDVSAALTESGYPPPARGGSAGPLQVPAAAPLPGTAAAAAALKAMPTVPRPMFPGQLQSLLHEEPVKEPTMMKQAAELLEEALKEAGGSMADIGENPLFNRPSRHPRPLPSTQPGAAAAVEDALSATRTLADQPAGPSGPSGPQSARATTTAIGLPPPPGLKLGGASSAPATAAGALGTAKTLASPAPPPALTGDEPTVARKAPSIPPPIPASALPADTTPQPLASESDIQAAASEDAIPKAAPLSVRTPEPASARLPVSARAQLGSRSDAERRSGGGGIIWAGLGVVVVFGLFGVYKMGLFGGSGDQPAPSATAVDTSAPSASAPGTSAAPSASASATTAPSDSAMTAPSGAMTAPSPTTSAAASSATAATAATAAAAAAATAKPTATVTATPPVIRRPRPKPTATEDDTTPDAPASTATSASTSTSAASTATATATATSTATSAPTTKSTGASTSAPAPTATSTSAPTSTSGTAPTSTMRRTIGTAAPTANDAPP